MNGKVVPPHVLDDPVWAALTSVHEAFAEAVGSARRYRPDVSVFAALADGTDQSWASLARMVGPGGSAVLARVDPFAVPPDWTITLAVQGHQMILSGELPSLVPPEPFRPLDSDDADEMVALVELTQPGPFRARTVELGGYYGIFEEGRLVAMAGTRLRAPGFTEISAVCTHPDVRRRGYGAVVTVMVARHLLARGETPFLHVAQGNDNARRIYQRLGFTTRALTNFMGVTAPSG